MWTNLLFICHTLGACVFEHQVYKILSHTHFLINCPVLQQQTLRFFCPQLPTIHYYLGQASSRHPCRHWAHKSWLRGTGCAQWLAAVLVLTLPQLMPAAYPVVKTGESPRIARHPGPALLPDEKQ